MIVKKDLDLRSIQKTPESSLQKNRLLIKELDSVPAFWEKMPIYEILTNFSSLENMKKFFDGKSIDEMQQILEKSLKQVDAKVKETCDNLGFPETIEKNLNQAVRRFMRDSTMLYQVAMVVNADKNLTTAGFEKEIDTAIVSAYSSIFTFLQDFSDIRNSDLVATKISNIFMQEASKTIDNDLRKEMNDIAAEIISGNNRELIDSITNITNIIKQEKGKINNYIEPYTILNYHPKAVFEIIAEAFSQLYFKKMNMNEVAEALKHSELLSFPSTNAYPYGRVSYLVSFSSEKIRQLSPEIFKAIYEICSTHQMPSRSPEWIAKTVEIDKILDVSTLDYANEGLLEKAKEGKISKDVIIDCIIELLKNKMISPLPDVLPPDYPEKWGRSVDIDINDFISEKKIRDILSYWWSNIEFAIKDEAGDKAIAFTDGEKIKILPYLSTFNTRLLNTYLYFRVITHEKNHIQYGSFKWDPDKEPDINLMRVKDIYSEEYKEKKKKIENFQSILQKTLQDTNNFIKPRLKKGRLRIAEFQRAFVENLEKNARDNEYAKEMAEFLNGNGLLTLHIIHNILEDYRIDKYFETCDSDNTLSYRDNEELRHLRSIYRFMKYTIVYLSAAEYIDMFNKYAENKALNEDPNVKEKMVDAINLVLFMTKLETLFDHLFKDFNKPNLFAEEIKELQKKIYQVGEDGKTITRNVCNDSYEAAIEYLALMIVFKEKIPKLSQTSGNSCSGISMPGEEGASDSGISMPGEEGASDSGMPMPGEKGAIGVKKELLAKGNAKMKQGNYDQPQIPSGEKMTKGNFKEGKKKNIEMMVIPRSLVKQYHNVLLNLLEGMIKINTRFGRSGASADLTKFAKFIYMGGTEKVDFFKRTEYSISEEGSELKPRPINIYIGIDTSSSMDTYTKSPSAGGTVSRVKFSLTHALALIAAYNTLRFDMKKNKIDMKLLSISTGAEVEMMEFDASTFKFNDVGNEYRCEFNFEDLGGGTDLVNMIDQFEKRVESINNKTNETVLHGKRAINPSILTIYFTDFGDNSGDATGVAKSIAAFGSFAEKYQKNSRLINIKSKDVGLAVIFAVPDNAPDDRNVYDAAHRLIGDTLMLKKGNELADAIHNVLPVLHGDRASNVKKK